MGHKRTSPFSKEDEMEDIEDSLSDKDYRGDERAVNSGEDEEERSRISKGNFIHDLQQRSMKAAAYQKTKKQFCIEDILTDKITNCQRKSISPPSCNTPQKQEDKGGIYEPIILSTRFSENVTASNDKEPPKLISRIN